MIRFLSGLISLTLHGALAAFFLSSPGGAALEKGAGQDTMVVEQGIAVEGLAKLGEDETSIEPIDVDPVQASAPTPPQEVKPVEQEVAENAPPPPPEEKPVTEQTPENTQPPPPEEKPVTEEAQSNAPPPPPDEVKPAEDTQVITSDQGPEQENVLEPEPEQVQEAKPADVQTVQPTPKVVQQPPPPQVAAVEEQSIVAEDESSGKSLTGGDVTAQSAYLGVIRSHLEKRKINPRTEFSGTAVVDFEVDATGRLISRSIRVSSGRKVLDEAALASIDKAQPFPPMPKGLNKQKVRVSVPFKFSVR